MEWGAEKGEIAQARAEARRYIDAAGAEMLLLILEVLRGMFGE